MLRHNVFVSRQSLVKARTFYVVIEYFHIATKFGLERGFYVAIEYFHVATEFGLDRRF